MKLNIIGERYGRLLVLSEVEKRGRNRMVKCLCDCGKESITSIGNLRGGKTKSCGCLAIESKRTRSVTHGMRHTSTYRGWGLMKNRCLNKRADNYKWYGGSGITVCKKWLSFNGFYEDMGERPRGMTLERIDNKGGYCKGNCKWATHKEQCNNRRTNHFVEICGVKKTIAQWSRACGLNQGRVRYLVEKGHLSDIQKLLPKQYKLT